MLFLPLSINVVDVLDIVYRKKPSQSKFHPRGERDQNKNRAKDFDLMLLWFYMKFVNLVVIVRNHWTGCTQ